MFTQEDFKRLADVKSSPCLTIYIPTHRSGEQTHNRHDAIMLKDAIKDARKLLSEVDKSEDESMLAPLAALIDDEHFGGIKAMR